MGCNETPECSIISGPIVRPCAICPHKTDCVATGACLDEINARYLGSHPNQFPEFMTPAQANRCMDALKGGSTRRRVHGYRDRRHDKNKAIVTPSKLEKHSNAYPEWGAEVRRLAEENQKASDKLKGIGASRADKTHCRNGHPYAIYGTFKAKTGPKYAHMKGRLFRYCKACNIASGRNPAEPLPAAMVDQIKDLLRHGNSPHSFTNWGAPGRLCKFYAFKQLCENDSEVNNLAALSLERRKLLRLPREIITIPKPAIVKVTNLRAPTLTGRVAGGADVVFSAVNDAVSLRLPRHIRDEVMGQLYLDVEEGRVAFCDIKRFARKYTSDLYEEEKRQISLDAPAFRDGTGGSKLDRLSEADGIWA
jgi:hypothetical protein